VRAQVLYEINSQPERLCDSEQVCPSPVM
jgi:hypothetical protein